MKCACATRALDENDSDANLFLARMNEPETQAAVLLGIDDPHIRWPGGGSGQTLRIDQLSG